jgi:hypothetical protein
MYERIVMTHEEIDTILAAWEIRKAEIARRTRKTPPFRPLSYTYLLGGF